MTKRSLIDLDYLGELIYKIEGIFKEEELTQDDQQLLLDMVRTRILNKIQKQKMRDSVMDVPLKGLMKKILKKDGDD